MIPDNLAAELPAPRDDEPESLRQDIIDELTDHLHCALHRELLANRNPASGGRQSPDPTNEQSAFARVLHRFGNPAALARRLWFDAMKERIMSRRIIAASAVLAAAAVCLLTFLMWQRSKADRQFLVESLDLNRELIDRLNTSNQQLISQLESNQTRIAELAASDTSDVEWVRGEVIAHEDTADGPPAEGVRLSMSASSAIPGGLGIDAVTDRTGYADLGLIHVGFYNVFMTTQWEESSTKQMKAYPGKQFSQHIVAPSGPPEKVNVSVRAVWPTGFDPEGIWILLWTSGIARGLGEMEWRTNDLYQLYNGNGSRTSLPQAYALSPSGVIHKLAVVDRVSEQLADGSKKSLITWRPDDSNIIKTLPLPDRSYSFGDVSFVVDSPVSKVRHWEDEGLPTRIFVPDSARSDGADFQKVVGGEPPQLVIEVPAGVVEAIQQFRDDTAAAETSSVSL